MKDSVRHKTYKRCLLAAGLILAATWLFCLPKDLFKGDCYSTVVLDKEGNLLGARIADDGQWRFPPEDAVPYKFAASIIEFEDAEFLHHYGVNPLSLARAFWGNVKSGKVTSGGSTITMQVIRLSRRGKPRTVWQKIIEAFMATRLEARFSKKEILALYASHAPFGGNVVGLEAAAWRYYGCPASELSWAESATLAVLPNSPSDIHPGKNRDQLLKKRNRLLDKLYDKGYIGQEEHSLAKSEPLTLEPGPLPSYVPHLVDRYWKSNKGETIKTSIDLGLQQQLDLCAESWNREFKSLGINDLAAVVIDVETGETIAYCGNASPADKRHGAMVDIADSPRSTGSVLKPFLFCAMLQEGLILPNTLLADTPMNINGFTPRNFDLQYAGAVPASEALARSLNVPAVNMLRMYGVPQFHELIKEMGMSTITRTSADYGLSIILGGAEGKLTEITGIYARLSKVYQEGGDFPLNDRVSLWHTFDALKDLGRPDEIDLRMVRSVRKAAWKTGTSWGFRDAWAVGITPDYAVGVWAGNADGSGVPGLIGARTAGPVMFDILNLLPEKKKTCDYAADGWFLPPLPYEGITAEVCHQSGHLKGLYCTQADTLLLPKTAMNSAPCPYHNSEDGLFLLPPAMEWYYKQHHPEYTAVAVKDRPVMEFISPENGSHLKLPRQLDGSMGSVVFNLAHRSPGTTVWWHLDGSYLGQTTNIHQMTLSPSDGEHILTVVDAAGNSLSLKFTVE